MNENEVATTGLVEEIIKKKTERIEYLLVGVILVLGLGFVTLLVATISPIVDALRFKAASYESLSNQVSAQNAKIDAMLLHQGIWIAKKPD